jgi:hypothetical protein
MMNRLGSALCQVAIVAAVALFSLMPRLTHDAALWGMLGTALTGYSLLRSSRIRSARAEVRRHRGAAAAQA